MKTFVILSDSHGRKRNLEKIMPLLAENDFCHSPGDGSTDLRDFMRENPEKVYILKGIVTFPTARRN